MSNLEQKERKAAKRRKTAKGGKKSSLLACLGEAEAGPRNVEFLGIESTSECRHINLTNVYGGGAMTGKERIGRMDFLALATHVLVGGYVVSLG